MALHHPKGASSTPAPATTTISATEFKATCLELMDEVARTGAEVIVTKHGRPVVRVSAIRLESASPVGWMAGSHALLGDLLSPEQTFWESPPTDPPTERTRRRRGTK